jgi:predicted TIM-barrel fold metal-dependent hydrolase
MWIRKSRKDRLRGTHTPLPTQVVSNGEFHPMPQTVDQKMVEEMILSMAGEYGRKLGLSRRDFLRTSGGMATAFLAMNKVWGENFQVSEAEALESAAFGEQWPKDQFIFDVQTHHVKDSMDGPLAFRKQTGRLGLNPILAEVAPKSGDLHRANYLKEIFLDSDTVMAMISGAAIGPREHYALPVEDMVDTRNVLNKVAGSQRMLSHGLGDPTQENAFDDAEYQVKELGIDGWKFYTGNPMGAWRLDDQEVGLPYLEKINSLGVANLSMHKGLPLPGRDPKQKPKDKPKGWYWMTDDVFPAASQFPDMNFIVYHSGMKNMVSTLPPGKSGIGEDGYLAWTTDFCKDAEANPAVTNVYAELGTVFAFCVVTHPEIAGHLLGQLMQSYGPDRILWGTDCIWWGSPQWIIEAFRRFQIPESLQERFGYPALTAQDKEKIFGLNAAKLYGIDVDAARTAFPNDQLAAVKQTYRESGGERTDTAFGWVAA